MIRVFLYIEQLIFRTFVKSTFEIRIHIWIIFTDPTKNYMIDRKDDPDMNPYFKRAFDKRPEYELFNVKKDPYQFVNLANDKAYAKILKKMKQKMDRWMKETEDPRAISDTDIWDTYPYYGKGGVADGKGNVKKAEREKKGNKKRRILKIEQE